MKWHRKRDPDGTSFALEVLSVTIGGIMLDLADLAVAPPDAEGGYLKLAGKLERAAERISILARAMAVVDAVANEGAGVGSAD